MGFKHRNILTALILYSIGASLGLAYLWSMRENPFYTVRFTDDGFYLTWARFLADGRSFLPTPFYVNPFYLYFLASLMKLHITTVEGLRAAQVLLVSATYPLVYLLGERMFGRAAGLVAAAALLGYGPFLHAMTYLQSAGPEALLVVVLASLLTGKPNRRRLIVAGVVCGVLSISRPTFLPFIPLGGIAILLGASARGPEEPRRNVGGAVAFCLACVLTLLPVTRRNLIVGGDLVVVSTHGGVNFYIGNNPAARGGFAVPLGMHGSLVGINRSSSARIAEESVGHALKPSEVSRFWFRKGLRFLADSPGKAAILYGRKALLLMHSYEAPENIDYALAREGSALLRALAMPFALLFVAGFSGLILSGRSRHDLLPVVLMLGTQSFALLLFFVSSRYRLPLAPLWAICAGHALTAFGDAVRSSPRKALVGAVPPLVAVLLLSYPYAMTKEIEKAGRVSQYLALGTYLYDVGKMEGAEKAMRSALNADPSAKKAHRYLALIMESRQDYGAAAAAWRKTAELYGPSSVEGRQAAERLSAIERKSNAP